MPLEGLHREVAEIALQVAGLHGFALGGGNALIAHKIVDRPTQDVDLFTDREDGVAAAAVAVEEALRAQGYDVERRDLFGDLTDVIYGLADGMAEWVITSPDGGKTTLQLGHFDREHGPVIMDVGPVLAVEDAVGSKITALAGRAEVRDFIDAAAARKRFSVDELIGLARRLDPGLTGEDFAFAGQRLDEIEDWQFGRYGLGEDDVARLRDALAGWPRS